MADGSKQAGGDAWGDDISDERKAELEQRLQAWEQETDHGERKGPFDGVKLTGADVFWLAVRAIVGKSIEMSPEEGKKQLQAARDDLYWQLSPDLSQLHLEFADLSGANLKYAVLNGAHLQHAELSRAHLEHAALHEAHLEGAYLSNVHLEDVFADQAHLEGAIFLIAHLERAILTGAHLEGAVFLYAHLVEANLDWVHLEGASLSLTHLEGARLNAAHLGGERMPPQDIARVQQWKPDFSEVLQPAYLNMVFFDSATMLNDIILGDEQFGYAAIGDVVWGDVNLAVVEWTRRRSGFLHFGERIEAVVLGNERYAHGETNHGGKLKSKDEWLKGYKDAVRANRQLATALRNQGLNEDADRFAYKAQKLQRQVLRRQGRWGAAFGSWFLDLIAGYGYKPMQSFITYVLVVGVFAVLYFLMRESVHPALNPLDAIIFSITSFHGRGFNPGESVTLHNPLTIAAAVEAVIGLLIEITFIATFTQRFFAR